MSLKKILKIIGFIILLLIGTSLFLSYRGYSAAKKDGKEAAKLKDYFPFGRTGTFTRDPVENTEEEDGENTDNEITDDVPNNKLVQVSENPIAGYEIIQKEYFVGENEPINIQEETVTVTPRGIFERELKYGSTGEDVRRLQQTLNDCPELGLAQTGPGSKGKETTLYVDRTVEAIKKIQLKFKDEILKPQNLTEPTGILDELTRKKISAPFICSKVTKPGANQPLSVLKSAIRFIERATGNVFDYNLESGEIERITNTTIPRIQEAFFTDNGQKILIRYLKEDNQTIETYLGNVPERRLGGDTSEAELTGSFMQKNIIDLSVSPDIKKVFYQTKVGTSISGTIFTTKSETKNTIFSSPFSEWLPQWVNEDNITMTTKASGYSLGYIYNFNTKTGEFTRVLGDIFGLTTNTSPNYKNILFSKSTSTGNSFGMYDVSTKNNYDIGINTLAEKCVWNKNSTFIYCAVPDVIPSGVYPDDWYQSTVSFTDQIVLVDPTGLIGSEELVNPGDEGQDIDGINIKVTDDEQYVLFMNKKDGILWMTKTK